MEDFEDTRRLYTTCLSDAGFTVVPASDGAAAVALATSRRVDAIVMDLQLPEMDGYEAMRRIRGSIGTAPYVLALSAYDGPESRRGAYDAGADDFLSKPIDPRVLVTVIRAALRSRAPQGA